MEKEVMGKVRSLADALFAKVTKTSIKKLSLPQLERRTDIGFSKLNKLTNKFKKGGMKASTFRKREYSIVKKIEMLQLRMNKVDISNLKRKKRK